MLTLGSNPSCGSYTMIFSTTNGDNDTSPDVTMCGLAHGLATAASVLQVLAQYISQMTEGAVVCPLRPGVHSRGATNSLKVTPVFDAGLPSMPRVLDPESCRVPLSMILRLFPAEPGPRRHQERTDYQCPFLLEVSKVAIPGIAHPSLLLFLL